MERIKTFFKEEGGVTAIEYALMASLIAMAIIASVILLGSNVSKLYDNVATKVASAIHL